MKKEGPVCPGCLRPYRGPSCPRCGELMEGLYVPNALDAGTVLGNTLLLGRALDAGEDCIRYLGYDQRKKSRVLVRELFAPALMVREEDGAVRPRDESAGEAAADLLRRWEGRGRPLLPWNGTVYDTAPFPRLPWRRPGRAASSLRSAWASTPGAREEQQDACQCALGADWAFAVLCDGMGGLPHGAAASAQCVSRMVRGLPALLEAEEGCIPALLREQVQGADAGIAALSDGEGRPLRCGTTLVCAYVRGRRLYYAAVGDSHLYLVREDGLLRLNEEHNLLSRLRRQGREADTSPLGQALTSFIGMGGALEIDCNGTPCHLEPGDMLLLCSDGVYRALAGEELTALCAAPTVREAAAGIIRQVEEKHLPGQDNATCAVLRLLPDRR